MEVYYCYDCSWYIIGCKFWGCGLHRVLVHCAAVALVIMHVPATPPGLEILIFFSFLLLASMGLHQCPWWQFIFVLPPTDFALFSCRGGGWMDPSRFSAAADIFLQPDCRGRFSKIPDLPCKHWVEFVEENSARRYNPPYLCSPWGFTLMVAHTWSPSIYYRFQPNLFTSIYSVCLR